MNKFKKMVEELKNWKKNDPVYYCSVYKEIECSYVDGMLCSFPSCSIFEDYEVKKMKTKLRLKKLERILN
jgi:hypothetical protein